MKNILPLISLRLRRDHLETEILAEHLDMIRRCPASCDAVWLWSDNSFPPLDAHQDHAEKMGAAAQAFRQSGIAASLQITSTLGSWGHAGCFDCSGLTWQTVVDFRGNSHPGLSCPRAPEFHAYLDQKTRAYCVWQPDRLWIDDDLRMNGGPGNRFGCFCELCLAEFSRVTGRAWEREPLVRALNEENDIALRARWLTFIRESLAGVARTVGNAAAAVAPDCRLGFQHIGIAEFGYNGPDWTPVLDALHEAGGTPVGSRPGHGFYNDQAPRDMLTKGMMVSLQNQRLAEHVDAVCYECDNLPGTVFGKSARGTALECTLAIAQGCNSLSLTSLQFIHEHDWHETMLSTFADWRPFWERLVRANQDSQNTGVQVVLSREQAMRKMDSGEPPFAWSVTSFGTLFTGTMPLGLPLCWNPEAPAALLCADAARGICCSELEELKSRGLILDGPALEVLESRGMAHIIGLRIQKSNDRYFFLDLTDDPVNGPHANTRIACCSYMFGSRSMVTAEPLSGDMRPLSIYRHDDGRTGPAEAALYEHADGSRIAFFGWGIDSPTVSSGRRYQILSAADWTARGRLPVRLHTPCKVSVVPRCRTGGHLCSVMLMNMSMDPTPPLALSLCERTDRPWTWHRPTEKSLTMDGADPLSLPPLKPWGAGVLIPQ